MMMVVVMAIWWEWSIIVFSHQTRLKEDETKPPLHPSKTGLPFSLPHFYKATPVFFS
jgi:hypothetical protein